MTKHVGAEVAKQRRRLYKKYAVDGKYAEFNKSRIDFVLDKVYRRQLKIYNSNEEKVKARLEAKGLEPEVQKIIPIASKGGKLQHLYIADMVVGNTIIEVDGPQHRKKYDDRRDKQTGDLGYSTIRIPTSDLSDETIDNYLAELN